MTIRRMLLTFGSLNTALLRAPLTTDCSFCVFALCATVADVTVPIVRLAKVRLILLMVNTP